MKTSHSQHLIAHISPSWIFLMKNKVPLLINFFVTSPLTFVQMTKVSYCCDEEKWRKTDREREQKNKCNSRRLCRCCACICEHFSSRLSHFSLCFSFSLLVNIHSFTHSMSISHRSRLVSCRAGEKFFKKKKKIIIFVCSKH